MSMNKEAGSLAKRQTVADEILCSLSSLSTLAEELANIVNHKLSCICQPPLPANPSPTCDMKNYPPYFNDLRERIESIYNSVHIIKDVMDRTEV